MSGSSDRPASTSIPPRVPWVWAVVVLALVVLGAWGTTELLRRGMTRDKPGETNGAGRGQMVAEGQEVLGWGRVKNPDDQCKVEVDGDRVRFVLPANTPSAEIPSPLVSYHPPEVDREVTGDFRVRVRVGKLDFQEDRNRPVGDSLRPYAFAELFVRADDVNFATLERCSRDWDTETGGKLDSVCRGDTWARARPFMVGKFEPAVPGHLELVRRGNTVTARASTDGVVWTDPVSITLTLPATIRVGVTARGVGVGPPFSVEFDRFEVVPLTATDK